MRFLACALACGPISVLASSASAATKAHKTAATRPLALRVSFHRAESGVTSLLADGRYVFLVHRAAADGTQGGVLIDDRTGQRKSISHPGCGFPVIGGPWLLFANCGSQLQLYPLAGGPTRSVDRPAGGAPVAMGRYWIEYLENCDEVHSCSTYVFQNIQTQAVRHDPTNANTTPDLDSLRLARRVCSRVRVPMNASTLSPTDRLVFDGRFAIATGAGGVFLERCGSRLHRAIGRNRGSIGISARTLVWQATGHELGGVFLPGLRRFTIRLPAIGEYDIVLGPRHLYVRDPNDRLWAARAPSLLTGR